VGSASATEQIAAIVGGVGQWIDRERPDWLLVEGDTNSVLGAALAAHKSGVRLGHVEAGLRSFDRTMPEETNRILTDHVSDLLFAPTSWAAKQLCREGIGAERVHVTGNTVVDELLRQVKRAREYRAPERQQLAKGGYVLATVHRAENTDAPERLVNIVAGLTLAGHALGRPVLCALHPRTRARIDELRIPTNGIRILPPLPYIEFLGLQADAALVLTDSGGVQEEACVLGVPCVTLRDNTERPESLEVGANRLAGADAQRIERAAVEMFDAERNWVQPFGDGHAAERILTVLMNGPSRAG
jgi:UDP-N-acetylglucosamine 2-epimerase (non-hydrolysing)